MESKMNLTAGEQDVLIRIGEGKTNNQIAAELSKSVRAIESRRKNLMEKTHTTNTATLIKYAVKNGLIS